MVTRELLKTEIDFIPNEYLDVLYRFMKSLEMSLKELRGVTETRSKYSEDTLNARKQQFFEFVNAHQKQPTIRQLLEELREIKIHEQIDIDIPARQDRMNAFDEVSDGISV